MKKYILFTLTIYFLLPGISQTKYPKDFFISPVEFKMAIAGTFGELRSNHFHSGIDIKTKQKKNIPIYASQSGYISRIKVSTHGFGKALYINHPNGFTTVYAHLENFEKKIEDRTQTEQYKKESFEIDFSLNNTDIQVEKGELIGFSGNTGSSTAPHLHFEIRETKTQKIINPMLFGLPILDRTNPIINSILIYHDNGKKEMIKTRKIDDHEYQLLYTPNITGPFNIGVNTYDLLDAAPNKNGVYSIELYINDSLYFANYMNKFAFSETRYINSHIDYEYHKKTGLKFQKCFLEINNHISTNQKYTTGKIGSNANKKKQQIKLIIKDSYGNHTLLEFNTELNKKEIDQSNKQKNIAEGKLINCKQVFEFKDTHFEIYLPNNSLYKDYVFKYNKRDDSTMTYPIYQILDDSIPSHKSFVIAIKENTLPIELRKKALIGRLINEEIHCLKSTWKENSIIGQSNKFGEFTIVIDTIKPKIEYKKNYITDNQIQFKISDELSGIKEYRGEINGEWILMEYDFKTDILKYIFREEPSNKTHQINVSVTDYTDNTESVNINFVR